MPDRTVVLINANEMQPPVAPIALDYLAGALDAAGFAVRVIDGAFGGVTPAEIARELERVEPCAVGITFRNTDDCFWPRGQWFVPRLREIVDAARAATSAPLVLGGCGFSIFPARIMDFCGVDLGIVGDGEAAFTALARALRDGGEYREIPGLAFRDGGAVRVNGAAHAEHFSASPARRWIDNARYFREGGMGNVETKRGCPGRCIYCADPLGKGNRARPRSPLEVADEIESLIRQGVDVLHVCDSEFNMPPAHARSVCDEIIRRGLGARVRWYCYAAVTPFSESLAMRMRQAGCVGINFGADSGCDRMLAVLGRGYRSDAIGHAVTACRRAGIAVMLDLLIGGPGEDEASVRESIAVIKSVDPDRAGAAVGVRVYPGTRLARTVAREGPLEDNPNLRGHGGDGRDFFQPVFYIDRRLGSEPGALVASIIGDDARFFQPAAGIAKLDYNYNDNRPLVRAIAAGARGAFWDILRRLG
jgi:tryptophan 2-C-methyltransferase